MLGSKRSIRLFAVVLCVSILAPVRQAEALRIRARQAGAFDMATGSWIYAKSLDTPVPIASLTKVVAALTFLRLTDDLDQTLTIERSDWVRAGKTRLRVGDQVPAHTLLRLALVASDNCAARALTHAFDLDWEAYGSRMQETAWLLGCRNSRFVEPTGLDERNVSTVRELVLLFSEALMHPVLREMLGTSQFVLRTKRGPRNIVHSSRMLRYRSEVVAAKTGYISEAGYCLVQYVEDPGGDFITVVLGAPTKTYRIRESARLVDYVRSERRGPSAP